jgi:UDP-glucuronate 4-epimerase
MKLLLTGAAGFVGYHCAARFLAAGHEVLGLDSMNDYYDPSLKEARLAQLTGHNGFSFEALDIADGDRLLAVFESFRPDVVVNLAAQAGVRYSFENPRAYLHSNMDGFLSILEACRAYPVRHLIYASSSSVYGANTRMPFSEHHGVDHPVSLYAATKRANELMAHVYAQAFGIPSTGLRFFTVYGPWGRPDMAYFKFTKAIFEGATIDLYDAEAMRRDFTYIDDVTQAIGRLLSRPPAADPTYDWDVADPASAAAPWRVYNIGNHTPVRLLDFVSVIENAVGRKAIVRRLPKPPGDVQETHADVGNLRRDADFAPDTSIEDGIARFVAWYREFYRPA